MKIRGNTVGVSNPRPDWTQSDRTKSDYIKNKPSSVSGLPEVSAADDGKTLQVVNGVWTVVDVGLGIGSVTYDGSVVVMPKGSEEAIFGVLNYLTNVTIDNEAITAKAGYGYACAITPNDGYALKSVVITMGGVEQVNTTYEEAPTRYTWSVGVVTGDIVITAVAEEIEYNGAVIEYDDTAEVT